MMPGGKERVMPKRFPNDCTIECEYYYDTWDMSVDDWTNVCLLLKMQVDDSDMDYINFPCPLNQDERSEDD